MMLFAKSLYRDSKICPFFYAKRVHLSSYLHMNKITRTACLLTALLFTVLPLTAQQPFTGIIEYKFVQFEEDKDAPDKIWIYHSRDKVKMVMREKATGRRNWMMVNLLNDSLYMFDKEKNELSRMPIAMGTFMSVQPVKSDSVTTLFGYKCRRYLWKAGFGERDIWTWNAEQLPSVLAKYEEQNMMLVMMGQKNIVLGFDLYKNGNREGALIAETVTPMAQMPDSLFQLEGEMKYLKDILESEEMQKAEVRADSLIKAVTETYQRPATTKPPAKPKKKPVKPGSNKKKKTAAVQLPENYMILQNHKTGIPV